MTAVRVPPVALLAGAGLAQWAIARDSSGGWFSKTAAGVLGAASVGMLGSSIRRFQKNETTVNPVSPEQASSLVTDGPNALTRHPMYVGMAGLLAAHALYRGSSFAAIPVAAFIAAIDRFQIPAEEDALRERFGEEFEQYSAKVPRWLSVLSLLKVGR